MRQANVPFLNIDRGHFPPAILGSLQDCWYIKLHISTVFWPLSVDLYVKDKKQRNSCPLFHAQPRVYSSSSWLLVSMR